MSDTTTITVVAGDGEVTLDPVTATVTVIGTVPNGPPGADGTGIPDGGTTGQVLAKQSNADGDADWDDPTGGGGAVDSVNGETGVVVISAGDVGSTATGDVAATNVQSAIAELASEKATVVALAAEAALARNADNLTSGTVADARIASTLARDSEVTAAVAAEATLARNADNLASGTVADARIASTIARDSEVTSAVGAEATARDAAIAVHVNDATAAHAATAVAFTPAGTIAATTVQAAIEEVASEAGGGSGLPDPWTSNQTSGEVTATTDGTDATALIVEAVTGQTEPVLVVKNEDGGNTLEALPNGDLVVPVPEGTGRNVTAGDTSGDVFASFDVTNDVLVSDLRRGGLGLYAQNDGGTVRSQAYADAGLTGVSTDSGRRAVFEVNSANDGLGGYARLLQDDNKAEIAAGANVGQTLPLVDLKDENGVSVTRVLVSGAIGTSAGEPADVDILDGECFLYFDSTDGAARIGFKGKTDDGTVVESFGPMAP